MKMLILVSSHGDHCRKEEVVVGTYRWCSLSPPIFCSLLSISTVCLYWYMCVCPSSVYTAQERKVIHSNVERERKKNTTLGELFNYLMKLNSLTRKAICSIWNRHWIPMQNLQIRVPVTLLANWKVTKDGFNRDENHQFRLLRSHNYEIRNHCAST